MHTMTIEQEIDKLVVYHPDKIKDILFAMHEKDPKHTEKMIHCALTGYHLDEEIMCEALATIVRYDGMRAPFWSMTEFKDILQKNDISVISEKFNEYDLNFLTQYYFADFKSLGKDPLTFVRIAEDTLKDVDNPKACEAAYWMAHHRLHKAK